MWCIRRLPPQRGLLSEIISLSRCGLLILMFLCYLDICFLTFGIKAQGLGVLLLHLRDLGIFAITFFSGTFQKECVGGYLVYGSRYSWLKSQFLGIYTFGYTTCGRLGS
jgi:hypothetical protein